MRASIALRSTLKLVQAFGKRSRAPSSIVCEQTSDSDRHVVDATGGIEARGNCEPEIRGRQIDCFLAMRSPATP